MGFIMDGLDAEAYDREYSDRVLLNRIAKYFQPHTSRMLTVAGAISISAILDAVLPVLVARSLDNLAGATDIEGTIWMRVSWVIGAIFLSGVLSWTFNFLRQSYTARCGG